MVRQFAVRLCEARFAYLSSEDFQRGIVLGEKSGRAHCGRI
jgi:hypothetical protein